MKTVLIGIPVKNCAVYLEGLTTQLCNLTYPHHLMEVVFIENDSEDKSYEMLWQVCERLRAAGFGAVHLEKRDQGFKLRHENRHINEVQVPRLKALRAVRQHIVNTYLKYQEFVFWIDADFVFIPPDCVTKLVGYNVDVVIPLYTLPSGFIYDSSSFTHEHGRCLSVSDLMREHSDDDLVPMESVNAAALVRTEIYRDCDYTGGDGDQEGNILSTAARAKGFKLFFAPKVRIIHAAVSGTDPIVK